MGINKREVMVEVADCEVCGRTEVIFNKSHNTYHGCETTFFDMTVVLDNVVRDVCVCNMCLNGTKVLHVINTDDIEKSNASES